MDAAIYYQVIRSFAEKYDGAAGRLGNALYEIDAVISSANNLITSKNVNHAVTDLATRLGSIYKKKNKPQNLLKISSPLLRSSCGFAVERR